MDIEDLFDDGGNKRLEKSGEIKRNLKREAKRK
jgi:hypothetical protein